MNSYQYLTSLTNSFLKRCLSLTSRTEHSSGFLPLPLAAPCSSYSVRPSWNSSRVESPEALLSSCYTTPLGDHTEPMSSTATRWPLSHLHLRLKPRLCIWLPTWHPYLGLKGTTDLADSKLSHDLLPQTVSYSDLDHRGPAVANTAFIKWHLGISVTWDPTLGASTTQHETLNIHSHN